MQQGSRLVRHPERTQGKESAVFGGVKLWGITTQGNEAPRPLPLSTELQQPQRARQQESIGLSISCVLKTGSAWSAVIPAARGQGL